MFGYAGRILRVDLSTKKISTEKLDEEKARKYLGGRSLGARILLDELEPGVDPLGPENKLLFMTGPLTGLSMPGCARYIVMAKSPLTGIWGESNAGGFFGPELKMAGFDGIIIDGKANRSVYLWVHEGDVEIRDASHLWGRTTTETEKMIRNESGNENTKVASIGPAGEKHVKFACIMSDSYRAAGRCGLGAVMGSKGLKAVAVYGTTIPEVAEEQKFIETRNRVLGEVINDARMKSRSQYGTTLLVTPLNEMGLLPTKYFRLGTFRGAERLSGETINKTIRISARPCASCPLTCDRITRVESGPYACTSGGPEYEALAGFGSLCLNDNLDSIAKANQLCNDYGLDTVSTANVIGFSMECYERGIMKEHGTGGVKLEWGDHGAIVQLIEMIAERKGLGDILAEGVRKAAQTIGKDSIRFAMHVKGLEVPLHEPRGKKGVGLSYATSNRGACHLQSHQDPSYENQTMPELDVMERMDRFAIEGKPRLIVNTQDHYALLDSLIMCLVPVAPIGPIKLNDICEILSSTIGWTFSSKELLQIGERAVNICRLFNVREGIRRKDDNLPERFSEPLPEGASKGQIISRRDLNLMLDEYYSLRGWNQRTGVPKTQKLSELGLQDA